MKPNIREAVGWLISETPEAICVCSDLSTERLDIENTAGSGLAILRNNILEMETLGIDKAFKHSEPVKTGQKKPHRTENTEMQTLNTADSKSYNELQGLTIGLTPRETAARTFIVNSFSGKMPTLIPYALENESIVKLASYIMKYTKAKSKHTLYQYVFGIYRYCNWKNTTPDILVTHASAGKNATDALTTDIDAFIGDLEAAKIAPGTINNHIKGVKALLRASGITLTLPFRIQKDIRYQDRAPTPEELTRMIDIGDIRKKVIVSMLALGGFRIGTLSKLQYRHVRDDLERGITPVHLHIEAEITKGKYGEYDTFIGAEATEYLKTYLNDRRIGTIRREGGKLRYTP